MTLERTRRMARWMVIVAAASVVGMAVGCSSSGPGGPRLSYDGHYYYVAPEHAGFTGPQMAAGDAVAWSLQRQGTFAAPGTAFADAPVD